nr:MAG TPA: hypothetical protein [Caudoviricetes sp.]
MYFLRFTTPCFYRILFITSMQDIMGMYVLRLQFCIHL